MTIEQALKLIITKSPAAMNESMKTMLALRSNSPVVQQRYNHVVDIALGDPQAEFTTQERAILAENLEATDDETRSFMLRIRLTDTERAQLQETSNDLGMTMSEYARRKIFS